MSGFSQDVPSFRFLDEDDAPEASPTRTQEDAQANLDAAPDIGEKVDEFLANPNRIGARRSRPARPERR